ncbi:type 2 lanthipeptide synthetase LanM family protein [Brasilonema sp. UFV-L1]|uniref:type 2 lanthipeptide synthetase LanM family protein n=1 Tax=Brasilonema sp. UFV-L1 TaxID=2234130 RepID=UPI00145F411E|nr:type 2 lanthipeptide synthetase LanM family protein [Brasilonema sp. UFV-L1]NMG05527.1 type 2 lantipeptide synthetase LanM [Brasilonema sp. UFV-L1]
MQVSRNDLVKIVERASTMAERLSPEFLLKETQDCDSLSNTKLEKWCKTVAQGKQELFEKRLAMYGMNLSTVRPVLGSVSLANPDILPTWVDTLEKALKATTLIAQQSEINNKKPQHHIPFEEVFLGFIEVAREKLIAQTGSSYKLLSEESHKSLEHSLLQQLSSVYIQALNWEFSIFRSFHNTPFLHISQQSSDYSTEQYQKFVHGMMTEKLLSFFQEYSVLARMMATLADFWVDATFEFIQRLASDWSKIESIFQAELKQVVRVKPALSDSHNQGRTAIALTFDSGLKLIYKPKDLGIEEAYFQFLSWLNQHSGLLPFKLLKVINRSTYGWVECVDHLPCSDKEELERYYQRAGMLLCLVYSLQGTDCTDDNLIACGEYPVLVDMETLIYPQVQLSEEQADGTEAHFLGGRISNSVLDTGFLPQWQFGPDGTYYDVSALGQLSKQQESVPANVPYLDGIYISSKDYVEEIVDGFRQMYQFLIEERKAILAPDSPLKSLAHQNIRFIFRNTIVYSLILEKTLNPKFLRDGVDRSIQLDFLSRVLLSYNSKPDFWLLVLAELQALEQLDIPHFTTRADSDTLTIYPGQTLEKFFRQSGYQRVISRLSQFCQEDLAQQIGFIRSALGSFQFGEHSYSPSQKVQFNPNEVVCLTSAQMVQQAMAIATKLQKWAIRNSDGSASWITLGYSAQTQQCQFQPMGYDLYNGCTGVALFLAALEKVVGAGFRDLSLAALLPLRKLLHDSQSNQELAKKIGIGGATGLGSIIYALVRISQFLHEPNLLQDAKQAASLLTPEVISLDKDLDVMAGSAGAILGLLALVETTKVDAFLELAIAFGDHLLNNRVKSETGYQTWQTLDGKLLTGFSHGAAGIAYALLRVYQTTDEVKFKEAASDAIAYESSVFSTATGNWPDLRPSEPSFMTNWCHGATGIGLARLGSLAILDTSEIRQDIETALTTTQHFGISGVDHLCCGNFGRIEFLLQAACQLSRPRLLDEAQKKASLLVSRFEKTDSFADVYDPSFFRGIAGIGYELLRLAEPKLLPSVLLWK